MGCHLIVNTITWSWPVDLDPLSRIKVLCPIYLLCPLSSSSSLAKEMTRECRNKIAILMGCAPRRMAEEGHRGKEGGQNDLLFVFFFFRCCLTLLRPDALSVLTHAHALISSFAFFFSSRGRTDTLAGRETHPSIPPFSPHSELSRDGGTLAGLPSFA